MEEALQEQIEYYRQRADEYDAWWLRQGAYQLPPDLHDQWVADVAEAQAALAAFAPHGAVLELACGTGLWTEQLARYATQITAVDASPEMIELNRARLSGISVRYIVADLFRWEPPAGAFDALVFTYWLSHVPDERLAPFWDLVRGALAPEGRVFLVDSAPVPGAVVSSGSRPERRALSDGREFEVVKRYWTPAELNDELARLGWRCRARRTASGMILYADALPV